VLVCAVCFDKGSVKSEWPERTKPFVFPLHVLPIAGNDMQRPDTKFLQRDEFGKAADDELASITSSDFSLAIFNFVVRLCS
jgi:hypothetical protein